MHMQKKALEVTCYVLGAGAFGVFARWLQDQLAFDEAGLSERSVWNFLVPVLMIATAYMSLRFIKEFRHNRYFLPEEFNEAFANEGRLYSFMRWAIGLLMCGGSALLLASCEVDQNAGLLRALSVCGILSGASFIWVLSSANRPEPRLRLICLAMTMPIILFAVWLITSYKMNDINSVVWAYVIEILTASIAMLSFFRVAGFAFGCPKLWKAIFYAMFGAFMCIMALADERYAGMQLMLLAAGLMLVLYNWIMISNLQQKPAPVKNYAAEDDGFERLR